MEFCVYKGGKCYVSALALALGCCNVFGFQFSTIYTQYQMRRYCCPFSFGEAHLNEPQAILPGGLKDNFSFLRCISFNLSLDLQNNWL